LTLINIPVGANTITASYAGDNNYNTATATVAQTVAKATPTVTMTSSTLSLLAGVPFTLTITVQGPVGTTPAGVVNVVSVNTATNVSTSLGSCTLVNGVCTVTVAGNLIARGSMRITATYAGNASFNTASNAPGLTLSVANNSLTVTTSAASVSYRTALTITGSLVKFGTTANFTGTITFTTVVNSSTVTLGTCTVFVQNCSISYALLPVGTYTITGNYSGDSIYSPSSNTVGQVVVKRSTTSVVSSLLTGARGSQRSTLTVTIGTAGATGIVTILDGTTVLGTCTLATNTAGTASVCTFTTAILTAATHNITAVYLGDTNFNAVTSAILAVKIV
jgi:hypothetical protein